MVELELLGLHGDGEHVTLTDAEGRRYLLPVDDALRSAVRRGSSAGPEGAAQLSPKDIQAQLRAGASVEEVAERSGQSEDHVRRYLGPVVAERNWVVQQAQGQRVGRDSDAPRLGDLVLDRLAARGVDVETLEWTAVRRAGKPWEVTASFVAGEKEREARWSVDLSARALHAVDDEARWLSETELSTPPQPRRHLNPVTVSRPAAPVPPAPAEGGQDDAPQAPTARAAERDQTDSLLAELAANRGTRMDLQPELEPQDEDGGELWGPGAHPPASHPEQARDAHVLALPRREEGSSGSAPAASSAELAPEDRPALPGPPPPPGTSSAPEPRDEKKADKDQGGEPGTSGGTRRSRRRDRRSVPSWDEIVFGARPD